MYARMSRAKIRSGKEKEVEAVIAGLKDRLHEAKGARHWVSLLTDEGDLVVIGVFTDEQACQASGEINQQRWADAAHLLAGKPIVTEGRVLAFVNA